MTVAIPLKKQAEYTELKFALRSIDKFVDTAEVIIIGEQLPHWIDNVTWIRVKDTGKRQLSVKIKIIAALQYAKEILFSNDDIYFLKKTEVPYYWNGLLKSYTYTGSKELREELEKMGKPTKSFELHVPLVFKNDFTEIIKNFSSETLIRSAYCNYLEIEGEQTPDCKFVKAPKPDEINHALNTRNFISTGAHSIKAVKPYLENLFSEKSRFEL